MKIKIKSKSRKGAVGSGEEKGKISEEDEITQLQARIREETPESGTQLARYFEVFAHDSRMA